MVKSRQLKKEITIESGLPENSNYCRKCQKVKKNTEFFKALDVILDTNGYMSVCKQCIDELYKKTLEAEYGSIEKTVLYLCKRLNILYSEQAIESTLKNLETTGWNKDKFFGIYRARLLSVTKSSSDSGVDLTYMDNPTINIVNDNTLSEGFSPEDLERLKGFWGTTFSNEEIEVLETKYMRWSESHSIDTESERVLLKLICIKELDIDKAIASSSSTTVLLKEFQDLLKTSGLNPSSATLSGAGKSQETWGNFVKMIEETEPAEFYKDDSIFKDFDNINEYFQRFVVRSIKNFITGSKDFNLDSSSDDYEDDVFEDEEPIVPLEYKVEETSSGDSNA